MQYVLFWLDHREIANGICLDFSGNLHGGAVALIFDVCTSMAITACGRDGFWDVGHVSRSW